MNLSTIPINQSFIAGLFTLFFIFNSSNSGLAQSLSTLPKTTLQQQEFYIYTVNATEGFYAITKKFHISQQEILKHNPEASRGLQVGQKLYIPVHPATKSLEPRSVSSSNKQFTHTVAKGETLHSIARLYRTTIEQVQKSNPTLPAILPVGIVITLPQVQDSQDKGGYIYHTLEAKDTLYGLSRKYGVTMQEILDANPGVTTKTFIVGKTIRIYPKEQAMKANAEPVAPSYDLMEYRVKRRETYASIAAKFGIKEDFLQSLNKDKQKLKSGDHIRVPLPRASKQTVSQESPADSVAHMHEMLQELSSVRGKNQMKVALILPFNLEAADVKSVRQNRYLEFYEGFLMAVDSIKSQGTTVELYVYDTKTQTPQQIITRPELRQVDLIIGPASSQNIKLVSQFARYHKINMVNPFTFDSQAIETNPYLFQLNTPTSWLNVETSEEFVNLFRNHKIVFLKQKQSAIDKVELIDYLRHELLVQELSFEMLEYQSTQDLTELISTLPSLGEVVFVPLSSSEKTLSQIIPALKALHLRRPKLEISLFGYPEWQLYTSDYMDDFYTLNTYIYTRIYVNPFAVDANEFLDTYKYWYEKDLLSIYPRYGILGFDTGLYFLGAVQKYGKGFDNHIEQDPAQSIQTAMSFRRISNWGGFVNRSVYFVNFTPSSTIEKIEIK